MTEKSRNIITIITTVVIIIVISVMAYVIKTQYDILNALDESTKQQKFLEDNITRIESTRLSSADFEKKLASLNIDLNVIKADLKKVNGKIDTILVSEAKTPGGKGTGLPSTSTTPNTTPNTNPTTNNDCKDTYGYLTNIQEFKLSEPVTDKITIPFGSVQFNAAQENPWSYSVLPRSYSSTVVLATDAAGKKRAYTKISITPQDGSNKRYDLPEVSLEYVEKYPEAQFFLWNPRAMVGFDLGMSSTPKFAAVPSAQLFIASHGKTRLNSTWYIGGVGVGYDVPSSSYTMMITPFAYKITTDNSIFQNINIGPSVGVDTHARVYGLVGMRFGL